MKIEAGKILSVNVGGVREFEYNGRIAKSAIWKSPVQGRIAIRGINLDTDRHVVPSNYAQKNCAIAI